MTTESEAPLAWPFRIPVLRVFLLPFVQTRKRDRLLLILLACIMSTAGFLMQGNGSYDSDGWFLLATGREILKNGIPYANPWSFSSYRPIVVQQWLHDVLLYGSYTPGELRRHDSLSGSPGCHRRALHRLCDSRI